MSPVSARTPLLVFGAAALGASVEAWLVPASDTPALAAALRLSIVGVTLGLLGYRAAAKRHWV